MKKFEYLEIGRGIASLLVVLHHATLDAPFFYGSTPFDNFFFFGDVGVEFFFVLSGFIIYYIHSSDSPTQPNIQRYILKRLIRVYPIFLFVASLLLIAYLLLPQWSPKSDIINLEFLISSFLLLPSPNPPLLSVSWTLVHEIFFYMIFISIILNKRFGLILFTIWSIAIVAYNINDNPLPFPYSFYLSSLNLQFLLGILVAIIIKSDRILFDKRYAKYILLLGIVAILLNRVNIDYKYIELGGFITTTIYGLACAIIVLALTILPYQNYPNIFWKILVLLGVSSYSIYLIHNPIESLLHRIVSRLDLISFLDAKIIFLLIVTIATISGILLHLLIEKPLLSYLRGRFLKVSTKIN